MVSPFCVGHSRGAVEGDHGVVHLSVLIQGIVQPFFDILLFLHQLCRQCHIKHQIGMPLGTYDPEIVDGDPAVLLG